MSIQILDGIRDGKMPTAFQMKIYHAVRKIPSGYVTTYKCLAESVGCRSYRAVGQALRVNPYAPDVPCHRVIASDLRIGGFQGENRGLAVERKKKMLASEGVIFRNGKLMAENRMFKFGRKE